MSRVLGLGLAAAVLLAAAIGSASPSARAIAGEADPTFGAGGWFTQPFGFGNSPAARGSEAIGLGAMVDGRIVAVGTAKDGGGSWKTLALRLLENGTLDPSFGSGGWEYAYPLEPTEHALILQPAYSMYLEANGDIILGSLRIQGRLTPSGQLDPTFKNGQSPINIYALTKMTDGDILAAGQEPEAPPESPSGTPLHAVIQGLQPNGQADPAFGANGEKTLPVPYSAEVKDAIALAEGGVLLAGVNYNGVAGHESGSWVAEIDSHGTLSASFGNGGIVYLPGDGVHVSLASEPNGRIVVASEIPSSAPKPWSQETSSQLAVWGLSSSGAPDPAFGVGGETVVPVIHPGDSSFPTAATTNSAGQLFLAGGEEGPARNSWSSFVTELTADGCLETAFGTGGFAQQPPGARYNALAIDAQNRLLAAGEGPASGATLVERFLTSPSQQAAGPTSTVGHTAPTPTGRRHVIDATVSCKRTSIRKPHRRRRHRFVRCTIRIRHLTGRWKTLEITVSQRKRRAIKRKLAHIKVPDTRVFDVPARGGPVRISIRLRNGHHTAGRSWTIQRHAASRPGPASAIV